MSIYSMSGFGSADFEADGAAFRIDVKAVNHRNLSVRLHGPSSVEPFEQAVTRLVRTRLKRGAVTVHIHASATTRPRREIAIDREGARELLEALQGLAKELDAPAPTLELVMRHGDLVSVKGQEVTVEAMEPAVLDGLARALDRLEAMRRHEGAALTTDLLSRLELLITLLDGIEEQAPAVKQGFEERLRTRLEEACGRQGVTPDEARVVTELVLFADRCDVTEETVRARTHIGQFKELLNTSQESVGKRLEFLTQELVREFNTIGSKCRDATMAAGVVDAKVEVERIREQIQNIA
jgi:uncharacterized protein (TIGR00255 family)